ncbi:MAG: spondin domain-containing protein [Ignavibacteria bacterium]|nr:spondin domain-containing protein [Ignavibacteria bacterium]
MRNALVAMFIGTVLAPGAALAQPDATYNVTFDATWSAGTHPTGFPAGVAHFSGLIGGTHNGSVSFWNPGQLASSGIQNMAETGSKSPLDTEIGSAITGGTAQNTLSGNGTSSPGSASLDFDINTSHPLVTLVAMIAPSPDWFVGVYGLNLFSNGNWIDTTVQLTPWDAGTDDGVTFTSGDSPSMPHVNISAITMAPFNGTPPLGTFTFTRTSPVPVQLSEFTGVVLGNGNVRVDWTTLSETNIFGFEVQKSTMPSANFQTISNSFIAGHGTTTVPHMYSFADVTASPGTWYYRLKQIDLDGSITYSSAIVPSATTGVRERSVPSIFALRQNFPNPFNPSTTITYDIPRTVAVTLRVFNAIGQQVGTLVNEVQEAGTYSVLFENPDLVSGMYFYQLRAGEFVSTRRLIVLK